MHNLLVPQGFIMYMFTYLTILGVTSKSCAHSSNFWVFAICVDGGDATGDTYKKAAEAWDRL